MRTFRSKTGPFPEQPFYKPEEVESICSDELQRVGLYPADPAPVRIDRFIEKRFGVPPTYEDLPAGLLGFTRFGPKGVEEIFVSKALDEEGTPSAERLLRTTLAHEVGHGLLHAHLFVLGTPPESLFGEGLAQGAPKILCRKEGIAGMGPTGRKAPYHWWEYQANLAMGVLLLPKPLVAKALETLVSVQGMFKQPVLASARREEAARLLADTFDVNPIVARIRLEALYPASADQQLTL